MLRSLLVLACLLGAAVSQTANVFSEYRCFPLNLQVTTTTACVNVTYDSCSLDLMASVSLNGLTVLPMQPIRPGQEYCVTPPGLPCGVCGSLKAGTLITATGVSGCVSGRVTCLPTAIPEQCFDVGDALACNATNCSACASQPACGWCQTTQQCLPGTLVGPAGCTGCPSMGGGCPWFFTSCPHFAGEPECAVCPPVPSASICPVTSMSPRPSMPAPSQTCVGLTLNSSAPFCQAYVTYQTFVRDGTTMAAMDSAARASAQLAKTDLGSMVAPGCVDKMACLSAFLPCVNSVRVPHCKSVCSNAACPVTKSCNGTALDQCQVLPGVFEDASTCFDYTQSSTQTGAVPNADTVSSSGLKKGGIAAIVVIIVVAVVIAAVAGYICYRRRKKAPARRELNVQALDSASDEEPQRSRDSGRGSRDDASDADEVVDMTPMDGKPGTPKTGPGNTRVSPKTSKKGEPKPEPGKKDAKKDGGAKAFTPLWPPQRADEAGPAPKDDAATAKAAEAAASAAAPRPPGSLPPPPASARVRDDGSSRADPPPEYPGRASDDSFEDSKRDAPPPPGEQ